MKTSPNWYDRSEETLVVVTLVTDRKAQSHCPVCSLRCPHCHTPVRSAGASVGLGKGSPHFTGYGGEKKREIEKKKKIKLGQDV